MHEFECAVVYCQSLKKAKLVDHVPTGHQTKGYMLVDIGGGTVDISAFQNVHTENDNCIVELTYSPGGGPFGGSTVSDRFIDFIDKEVVCDSEFRSYLTTNDPQHCACLANLKNKAFESEKITFGKRFCLQYLSENAENVESDTEGDQDQNTGTVEMFLPKSFVETYHDVIQANLDSANSGQKKMCTSLISN